MRYHVGETYTFIRLERISDDWGLTNPETSKISSISVLSLKCKEHHKVAWGQDPKDEKKYDGYLFEDDSGKVWSNQYPTASYGQLNDSENQIVREYLTDEAFLALSENDKTRHVDKRFKGQYEDAESRIDKIRYHIDKMIVTENELEIKNKWEAFLAWIIFNVEYLTEKKVIIDKEEHICKNGNKFYFIVVKIQ